MVAHHSANVSTERVTCDVDESTISSPELRIILTYTCDVFYSSAQISQIGIKLQL